MAMAIEALSQVTGAEPEAKRDACDAFRSWDTSITKALVLLPKEPVDVGVEMFTTLQSCQLPRGRTVGWYQFIISSFARGEAIPYANGLIQPISPSDSNMTPALPTIKPEDMEPSATRTWYNRSEEGDLVLTDHFQSLSQVHLHHKCDYMQVVAETKVRRGEDVQKQE